MYQSTVFSLPNQEKLLKASNLSLSKKIFVLLFLTRILIIKIHIPLLEYFVRIITTHKDKMPDCNVQTKYSCLEIFFN